MLTIWIEVFRTVSESDAVTSNVSPFNSKRKLSKMGDVVFVITLRPAQRPCKSSELDTVKFILSSFIKVTNIVKIGI